jgi:acetyl-CoA carboxylase biotin carboxyl carrier protein
MQKRKSTAKKAAAKPKSAPNSQARANSAAAASNFDIAHIREIVGLMTDNDLSYFHIEQKDAKLEIRRGSDFAAAGDLLKHLPVSAPAAPVLAPAAAPAAPPAPVAAASPAASAPAGPTVNSPMVGTFYRSASPGDKPMVSIGDQIDENTTVCIVEAMKVMNEIKAEMRGTVARVLAEDGKPVQYGQPLFELKA